MEVAPLPPDERLSSLDERFQPIGEPQPLSPARKKVSFHRNQTANQRPNPANTTPYSGQHLNHLVGDTVIVSTSPKPKKKLKLTHFYDSPRVYIRTVFMKVGEIDTKKEIYDADIFIQAKWREPALDGHKEKKSKINWEELWKPKMVIQNKLKTDYERIWYEVQMTSAGEAFAVEKRRVKGEFTENMELQNFPFDTQCLSLVLTSEEKDVEMVEDMNEASLLNSDTFVDEQEWHMSDVVECIQNSRLPDPGKVHVSNTVLIVRIHATRRSGFFVWNIIAVMILICSLAMCTFSVSRNTTSNRLQLSFTLVLTAVAFKFVSNQSLPKISYLTMLDKYIVTSMALMHMVCVWHACIGLTDTSSSIADTLDLLAFLIFLVVFLAFQLIFCIVVKLKIRERRNTLLQMEKEYKVKVNEIMGPEYVERRRLMKELERKRKSVPRNFLSDTAIATI